MFRLPRTLVPACLLASAPALGQSIDLNVMLNGPATPEDLATLGQFGKIQDVMSEINAVILHCREIDIRAIRALACVGEADVDESYPFLGDCPPEAGCAQGAGLWNLDAINITENGAARTVPYDGTGVYIAVLDTGLYGDWRQYFPECRIASELATSFNGPSTGIQPNSWEHDNVGHGTWVTSIILGFRYLLPDPGLSPVINGVAPNATIIPVKVINNNMGLSSSPWNMTRGLLYVTGLKVNGVLGGAPLVVNISWGGPDPMPILQAAIDYAIAHGVVVVAAAGNEAELGMSYPANYPGVISAAASGWVNEFPIDDPTVYQWNTRDVPEGDPAAHYILPFSSRELPGQHLDVAAPGGLVLVPASQSGHVDYSYFAGTSAATPHIVGVAALLLQKNPNIAQAQVESIVKSTAMPLAPGCRDVRLSELLHEGTGWHYPTIGNHFANTTTIDLHTCWGSNATGAGVLQADAALAATPCPADFDGNGTVNFADLNAFAVAYNALSPAADFNHDGVVNVADLNAFMQRFQCGC